MRRTWYAAPAVLLAVAYLAVPALSELGGSVVHPYSASALVSAATVAAAVLVRRPRPVGPWLLITVALFLWAVGDVIYSWLDDTTSGSFADLAYLPAYACLVTALVLILRARASHVGSDTLIDAALIGVAGLLAVWELVIEPSWEAAETSHFAQSAAAIYPVLDVVLLVLLVQLLLAPGQRLRSIQLLAAGISVTFGADIVYAVLAQSDSYFASPTLGRLLDGSWLLSYALLAVAAWHPSMTQVSEPAGGEPRFGVGRLLAAGAALLTAPLVHVVSYWLYDDTGVETLLLSAVTIVPLVVWRIARLNRSTQAALDKVARREAYYRGVAVNSSDAFVVIDETGRVTDVSEALERLVRITSTDALGGNAISIVHADDHDLADALIAGALTKPGETVTAEVRAHTGGGGPVIWLELRITNLLADPAIEGIVINAHDITDRKRVEAELSHQAFHDSLTGLPNRALLHDRATHALLRSSRRDTDTSVIFCDLDGFKTVNDSLGHDVGDRVLVVIAERLLRVVRASDTVARMGGDEFVVLLEESTRAEADAIAQRILQTLTDPVAIDGTPLVVTGSLGLASARFGDGTTADDLLRDADTAMYEAKGTGRNRIVAYDPGMRHRAIAGRALEADLIGALGRGEFEAYYQPVVQLSDGRVEGFEALIRWNHPTRGVLLPAEFIDLAEESGSIIPIGAWMLRTACADAVGWRALAEPGDELSMSVNLSARQLAESGIVSQVADALAASGLPAECLVLELTESMLVQNPVKIAERLHALRALGVRLAIDDFGVGYSSLSYLQQFPFDILKIDRSFVDRINDPERVPAIVRGLLDLAHTLELDIIAEGIEEEVQWRSLVGEGCELGQGYLFARPMTHADATTLVLGHTVLAGT